MDGSRLCCTGLGAECAGAMRVHVLLALYGASGRERPDDAPAPPHRLRLVRHLMRSGARSRGADAGIRAPDPLGIDDASRDITRHALPPPDVTKPREAGRRQRQPAMGRSAGCALGDPRPAAVRAVAALAGADLGQRTGPGAKSAACPTNRVTGASEPVVGGNRFRGKPGRRRVYRPVNARRGAVTHRRGSSGSDPAIRPPSDSDPAKVWSDGNTGSRRDLRICQDRRRSLPRCRRHHQYRPKLSPRSSTSTADAHKSRLAVECIRNSIRVAIAGRRFCNREVPGEMPAWTNEGVAPLPAKP